MHAIFVYGSLKQGFPNHSLLYNQQFVGTYTTAQPLYHMHELGIYPGVTRGNQYIQGEVYIIDSDCLAKLDDFEENGKTYQRALIQLKEYVEPCWMYFLIGNPSTLPVYMERFQVGSSRCLTTNHPIASWEMV